MNHRRDKVLELTPQMLLTREGVNVLTNKGYKLNKIAMADGTVQYGLRTLKILPRTFQQMVRAGYLAKLELRRSEFTSVRSNFMDFSKLIFFGFLYKNFDNELFHLLITSPGITHWNRHNHNNIIDEKTKIKDSFLNEFLGENKNDINQIREKITEPIKQWINEDESNEIREKKLYIQIANRYLDCTRPFNWLVLCKFIEESEHKIILEKISERLILYIKRSKIADFLTLLLVELTVSAEILTLRTHSGQSRKQNGSAIPFLTESDRSSIKNSLEKLGISLTVAWALENTNEKYIGKQNKLELTIYSSEVDSHDFKERIEESSKSTSRISLNSLYEASSGQNAEMGLMYLGYLNEACREVDMRINSSVSVLRHNTTAISITINL